MASGPSQGNCPLEDAITEVGPKAARREHVHVPTKQSFQVDLELRVVEQAPAELEVHEDIDVTVRACLSPGHGSEHADIAGAMTLGDGQDLVAAFRSASICIGARCEVSRDYPHADN